MKKHTNTNLLIRSSLALALAIAWWLPISIAAADEPMKPMKGGEHQGMLLQGDSARQDADAGAATGKMMMDGKMMQGCQTMMEQKKKMAEDMKAQDAELTGQVANMNSASDDKKAGLMAAVITRMVEQRIAMDARMGKMQEAMMKHMMQHMQMGKESMAQCPMMKAMKGMNDMKDMGENPEGAQK